MADNQILPIANESSPAASIPNKRFDGAHFCIPASYIQKLIAEFIGTYFMIFGGCSAIHINMSNNNVVTLPGIAFVWGFIVMVMIYSVGHISGAHFNPAVTIAFASFRRIPWKQVPGYVLTQVLASTLACGTLRLLYGARPDRFLGTLPSGSNIQSLVLEIIATFYLMFVITAVATDDKANGEFAGLAIGATVLIDVLIAGPICGASMNPARSIGPAIVYNRYTALWIYLVGPIIGAVAGAWGYNIIRFRPTSSSVSSNSEREAMNNLFATM